MPKICNHTECTNNVFGGGFCKWHQYKRNDKTKPTMTRTKIRPISDKQQKRLKFYAKAREIYLKENPKCEHSNCNSKATEIHHKKGRGTQTANAEYFMSICRHHHTWIHEHPLESRTLKYLI